MSAKSEERTPVDTPVASSASRDPPTNNDKDLIVPATDPSAKTSANDAIKDPEPVTSTEATAQDDENTQAKADTDAKTPTDNDAQSTTDAGATPTEEADKAPVPGSARGPNEPAADYLWVFLLGPRCCVSSA
jgi:hypothetical protein